MACAGYMKKTYRNQFPLSKSRQNITAEFLVDIFLVDTHERKISDIE
jgi:hypothetical protein